VPAAERYPELLRDVARQQAGWGAQPQQPCAPDELDRLSRRVRAELRTDLPAEYAGLLARTNGLDWNGVVFYASETVPIAGRPEGNIPGLVETNLAYRDDDRFDDLLVFGSDGLDIYAYRISAGWYEIRDQVPLNVIADALSFDALMTKALQRSLN